MSQLDLAMQSGFSTRHVSFIETGRTQPSRQALLVLAETLEVPLRERNRLLEAGGYAHVYPQTQLAAEEMSHIRGVLQFILDRHQPYAAVVLDRYSNCLMGNEVSGRLLASLVDPSLLTEHANYLRLTFHPLGARRHIANWDQVARHLVDVLGTHHHHSDPLLAEIRGSAAPDPQRSAPHLTAADLLLPIHLLVNGVELRMFSTIMTLGTPRDVTLQELRVETFFPADGESEAAWRGLLGERGSSA